MGINWSHLPRDLIPKICMCTLAGSHDGFHLDPATGYWLHTCGKPTSLNAIAECDICEVVFIPENFIPLKIRDLGVMCNECLA